VFVISSVIGDHFRVVAQGLPTGYAIGEVRQNGVRMPHNELVLNGVETAQKLECVLAPATASIQVSVSDGAKAAGARLVLLPEGFDPADPADP
jgi:hypothetical protein